MLSNLNREEPGVAAKALAPMKVLDCGVQCVTQTADAACITVALPEVKIVSGTNVDASKVGVAAVADSHRDTHSQLHKHMQAHTHTHTHIHTHTHENTHTHTHTGMR